MAQRLPLRVPATSRLTAPPALPRRLGGARQLPTGPALWRLVWRIVWAPFWIGSDLPAPALPRREQRPRLDAGPAGNQVVRFLDRTVWRTWVQRLAGVLVRSIWLALAVGCLWLGLELSGGPAVTFTGLLAIGVAFVLLGGLFGALVRPTRRQVARMLDRSFGLQERMVTAVDNLGREVPKEGERASVVYLQIADAANASAALRGERALRLHPPTREIVLAVAAALVLAALFFLRGVGGTIPSLSAAAVPAFTPAAERLAAEQAETAAQMPTDEVPTTQEVEQRAQRSNQAQRDLQSLGHALADHAVTRPASEAIQRSDYPAAADQLRDLAQSADQLSESAREGLAQDLDQAAEQMSPENQSLADAAREAAAGLQQGSEAAQEGVRELGDAVEQTGNQVMSQRELAEQMQRAQGQDSAEQGSQEPGAENAGQQEQGQEGQQGQQASGQPGEGEASQSGANEGTDAQPGEGGDPSRQGGEQESSAPGQEGAADQAGGAPGQQGQGAQGEQAGAQNGAQAGADSANGEQGSQAGQNADSQQTGQGAGAGSGQEQGQSSAGQPGAGTDQQQPAEGAPAQERVTTGDGSGGQGQQTDTAEDPRKTLQLPRTEGPGVQTSNDLGSSSSGAGAGVAAASGTTQQGDVAIGGPDSNRVPSDYRTLVEDYFSEPGADS